MYITKGKESAENTILNLAGFNVFADKVTGAFNKLVFGGGVSIRVLE